MKMSHLLYYSLQALPDSPLPRPPDMESFEGFGFAGILLYCFIFLSMSVIFLLWHQSKKRDEFWSLAQNTRDDKLTKSLEMLTSSHEKAVDRTAASTEKVADQVGVISREVTGALKDLTIEVRNSQKFFGEETISGLIRRAIRDVNSEKNS